MTIKEILKLKRTRVALVGISAGFAVALLFNNCSSGFTSAGLNSATQSSVSSTGPTSSVGMATLTWQAPTQNTDGTALSNLAGFHIYYGTSQNALNQMVTVADPSATTFQVNNLTSGTWYFAVSAYSTSGTESARSNVGSKTIQ